MNIYDISKSAKRKKIFDIMIEEACRQWCDFTDEAPERKSGEGFANFFYKIFEDKEKEYMQEYMKMEMER